MTETTSLRPFARKRLIVIAVSACFTAEGWANPTAPQVVNGSANVTQAGKLLTVTNSNGAIINWNTFSIGAGEATRFNQPTAASSVLNRVVGNDPSVILGNLSSNGRVWLVNPAGIMVGQGARIDVGAFIASSLSVRNEDFLAGRLNFQATPGAGKVSNHGLITTPSGGSVYLVGPTVENGGVITAPNGEVLLAAGQKVELLDTGTPGVKVEITGSEGNATNLGTIASEAGRIGIAGVLVKNSGTLNASSVVSDGGRVFLRATRKIELADTSSISADGTKGGSVVAKTEEGGQLSGELIAGGRISARGNGAAGSGGFVETSGKWVDINSIRVNTGGGTWLLDPDDIEINTSATIGGTPTLVTPTTIQSALTTGNFIVQSNALGTGGFGDIYVNSGLSWGNLNTLSLIAGRDINVNQGMSFGGGLNLSAGRNLNIANSVVNTISGGVLSLSGTNLNVTATSGPATLQGASVTANMSGMINVAASAFGGADFSSLGPQSITANGIVLQGGSSGTNRNATIGAFGAQNVTVGSGGIQISSGAGGTTNTASIIQNSASGIQTIGVTGGGMSVLGGGASNSAQISNNGSSQSITLINSNSLDVIAGAGSAGIYSAGTQAIAFTGSGAKVLSLGSMGSAESSSINGSNQSIAAQTINVIGGSVDGKQSTIRNNNGSQTITAAGTITLTGGTASGISGTPSDCGNVGACAFLDQGGLGAQSITAGGITMQGGSSGGYNIAAIQAFNTGASQAIAITGGGTMSLTGGSGGGTKNSANVYTSGTAQSVNISSGGNLQLTGGSNGSSNVATLQLSGSSTGLQTINTGSIQLQGGSSGMNNIASIDTPFTSPSLGQAITVGAGGIAVTGGAGPSGGNVARIGQSSTTGTQTFTVNGGNVSLLGGSGAISNNANITNSGTAQNLNVNDAALVSVVAQTGNATITSVGNQSLMIQGSGSANVLTVGAASAANGSSISGANQAIAAGTTGQSGSITLRGPSVDNTSVFLTSTSGTQTVSTSGALTLLGGTAPSNGFQTNIFASGTGLQHVSAGSISMAGGSAGSNNSVSINNNSSSIGGQTLDIGSGGLTLTGGTGPGGGNRANISQSGVSAQQTIRLSNIGNLFLAGGSNGGFNNGGIFSSGGAQLIDLSAGGNLTMQGGSSGTGNGVQIAQNGIGAQTLLANTNTSVVLIGSSGTATNSSVSIGNSATSGLQTINAGLGGINITGGSGPSGDSVGINQNSPIAGQQISVVNGTLTVAGGAAGVNNNAMLTNAGGVQVVAAGIGTAVPGNIVVTGGANGSNNFGLIKQNGATSNQQVIADGIVLTGGAGGGGVGVGNFAQIRSVASQDVSVGSGGLTLTGGSGSLSANFASLFQSGLSGTNQTINVSGGGNITVHAGSSTQTGIANKNNGTFAVIRANGDSQSINFAGGGAINLGGGTNGSFNLASIYAPTGSQTITGMPNIILNGGASGGIANEGNYASLGTDGGVQTIFANTISLQGGASGTDNFANVFASTQVVNANAITLAGGGGASTDNAASLQQLGTTGAQTININGGSIAISGGSSAGTNVGGTGHGSRAYIYSEGPAQQINFIGTGALSLTGGTIGSRNFAQIFAENTGTQTITGAPNITLAGGASGGIVGEGNNATISTRNGSQDINASSVTLTGGVAGTENYAHIYSLGAGSQSIAVTGGGAVTLQGGGGISNLARIRTEGPSQTIAFVSGGAVNLTGGTGTSSNLAQIRSSTGTQTIAGSPSLTLTGGASGGTDTLGNFAIIEAASGLQTITAASALLKAGAGGTNNFATIQGPTQLITVHGNLALTGGGSNPGTIGAGSRIGGIGGSTPTSTNLALSVDGNVTLTGGSVAGATGSAIGSSSLSAATNTDITINVGGNLNVTGGTASGARIGSPSGIAGGNITVSAGGNIGMNATGSVHTSIATQGSIGLTAGGGLGIGLDGVSSGTLLARATGGSVILNSGSTVSASGTGDSLVLDPATNFSNFGGATALQTPIGRWLVYSSNPASDLVGGLDYGFRQYAASPASLIAGAGNGLIYTIAPSLTPSLTGVVNKVYDGSTLAALGSSNFGISGTINGDTAVISTSSSTFNNKNAGTAKAVNANGLSIASAVDANGKPVFGYQLAATSAVGVIGTITPAPLTVNAASNTKVYDSTINAVSAPTIASGVLFGTDTAVLTESYANKNAGTGKTLVPTATIADGNGGANYSVTLVNNTAGVISQAPLSLTGVSANNKVYDGNSAASLNSASAAMVGVLPGDTVGIGSGTATFADRNAGNGKVITAGFALAGTDAGNYVLANPTGLAANITQLASVAWTGGAAGNWSQASNWAGGALPDGNNVLAVTIPTGSSVVYDTGTTAANTTLNSLTSSGALTLNGGAASVLTVNSQLATPQLAIASGTLAGGGNLTVGGSFSQTGGAIALTGTATAAITQAAGNLVIGNFAAPTVSLTAQSGGIAQTAPIVAAALQTSSVSGTVLTNSTNRISSILAANTGSGNIAIVNTAPLDIAGMTNANGNISVDNTGALSTSGPVSAIGGGVSLVAHSPLTIGTSGVSSTGNIVLTAGAVAGSGDDLKLIGPVSSTGAGATIILTAGDDLLQNSSVTSNAGNVSAIALTGSISMGAGATSASGGGSIGYATPLGNIVLASLNAGTGEVGVSAGGNLGVATGFSGANLTGASAIIAAGGNANLTTRARLLDVTVGGSFSITDAITGNVLSDVPSPATNVQPAVTQVVSAIIATTQTTTTSTTPTSLQPIAQQTAQPDPSAGGSGGSSPLRLIATGFTTGGTEGTFGGGSGSASSSSSGSTGSSSTGGTSEGGSGGSSSSDTGKPSDSGKSSDSDGGKTGNAKDDKADDKKDDKKKDEAQSKKADGKAARKKPAACT